MPTKTGNRYQIEEPSEDQRAREEAREEARELARWVGRIENRPGGIEGCELGGRPVDAAVDARLPVTRLFPLFEDSIGRLGVIGRTRSYEPAETLSTLPVVANVAQRNSLRGFAISAPMGECTPNAGWAVLLTTILTEDAGDIELREYETGETFTLANLHDERLRDRPSSSIYVLVQPEREATVQDLTNFAETLLDELHQARIVLVREIPAPPDDLTLPTDIAEAAAETTLELGPARPIGALSRHALAIDERQPELDSCGQRARTVNSDLAADLEVALRIHPSGRVESARTIGGSADARPLRACITDVVRAWTFPEHGDGTRVRFRVTIGEPPRLW